MSISSPDNIDAIRVITIHKSKGLQFPCVLIPMFDWNFDQSSIEWIETAGFKDKLPKGVAIPPIVPVKRDNKRTLFDNEFKKIARSNIMDSLNKTYVACTRAQYELIIYTENNKELGLQLSQFLETCRNNDISPTRPKIVTLMWFTSSANQCCAATSLPSTATTTRFPTMWRAG